MNLGNNFNQTIYKLNNVMGMPDAKLWQATLIILRNQLEPSIREIKEKMDDYSEIWSRFKDDTDKTKLKYFDFQYRGDAKG